MANGLGLLIYDGTWLNESLVDLFYGTLNY